MHPLLRLLGWCLLIAGLVGVLWPERPEPSTHAALGSQAQAPGPSPIPPGGERAPCDAACSAPDPGLGLAWLTPALPA